MELRHLRYFAAIAEAGHVTRAAATLGIQQAPLSQQMKALERELGAQLFRRKARGIELTDAGRALQKHALAILAQVEQATATIRSVARGEQGSLRAGLTSSACFHPFVPQAIRAFRRSHPQVTIQVAHGSTPALIEDLIAERIDVGFIRSAHAPPSTLRIEPLVEEPMVVALPAAHRLAGGKKPRALSLESLAGEIFVGYPRSAGAGLYDAIITACAASGFSPHIAHEAPQMVSTLNLVASGFGLSIVPASLTRLRLDGVVHRRLSGRHQPRAVLNLALRRGADSAALRAFAEQIKREAATFRAHG